MPDARQVMLVVGPGGVGKTTVAAALALRAADSGRRTIVVTIDPSRRLAQALGIAKENGQAAGEIVAIPDSDGRLDGLVLDTPSTFDAIVRQHSVDANAAEAMLNNPIYRATVRHLAGALEFAATAQVYMLHAAERWDLVVLDTPPTANAIEFLDTPAHLTEIVGNPAAKFLSSSSRIGMRFLGLGSGVLLKVLSAIG
ncbi:MAG TPA: ArsA-related P-loop ATPase, partial [Nannocystaceae bacterium]|nr:ArsA-related P-loop ATPase [Nannocystaceae bacterium]